MLHRQVPAVQGLESRELLTAVPGIDPGQYQSIAQRMLFGQLAGGTAVSETIQGFNPQVGTLTEVDVINTGVVAGGSSGSITLTGPSVSNTANLTAGGGSQTTVLTAPGDLAPFLSNNWLTYSEAAQGAAGAQATVQVIYHYVPASVLTPNNPSAGPLNTTSPIVAPAPYIPPTDPVPTPIAAPVSAPAPTSTPVVWTGIPTDPGGWTAPAPTYPDSTAYASLYTSSYTPTPLSYGISSTVSKRGGHGFKHGFHAPVYHSHRGR